MKHAAMAAAALALCLSAEGAFAQMAPPLRAPDDAAPDSELVGAAPAPERPGPLGEPAPQAVVAAPEAAPAPAQDATAVAAPEAPAAAPVIAEAEADAGPIGEAIPLGQPVPAPTRRSFLPAIRTANRSGDVSALGSGAGLTGAAFVDDQLTHQRVVDAQLNAKFDLKALFAERGLGYPPRDLYFRLFKQEQVLEVWVRDTPDAATYTLLKEYPICAIPGRLGPKTRVNDFQAPEGFYYIEGFNPESEFHLSLRLNYPNPADQIIGVDDSWGGDIYIHGGCSTVGCFPMTDEAMAELYWLAVEARGAGQNVIPVHVFPTRMHEQGMRFLRRTFERDARLVAFWENLREGYDWFETSRTLPAVSVDPAGRYLFAEPPAPVAPAASERAAPGAPPAEDGPIGSELPAAERPEVGAPAAEPLTSAPVSSEVPASTATPVAAEAPAEDGPLGAELPATTP